jgi:hypothetical protein
MGNKGVMSKWMSALMKWFGNALLVLREGDRFVQLVIRAIACSRKEITWNSIQKSHSLFHRHP